jgi:TorA maturation chaperone TorD
MVNTAKQRSNIYGLLAVIFRAEIEKPLLQHLKKPELLYVLSDMGIELGDDFSNRPEDDLIENLAVEYTRLFLGPAKHISPHESVHHKRDDGDWGSLFGADTVAVKNFIEASGLEYKSQYRGLPDHISVELELMQQAAGREAQAREENDIEGVFYCLSIEKRFIEEHLRQWVPVFCNKIISEAEMSFYREIAKLTKHFVEVDTENINGYIEEMQQEELCRASS